MDVPSSSYQGISKLIPNGKHEYFKSDSLPVVSHSLLASISPVGFGGMVSNDGAEQKDLPYKRKEMTSTAEQLVKVPSKRVSQLLPHSAVPGIRDSDPVATQTSSMISSKGMPLSPSLPKQTGQTKPTFSKSRAEAVMSQSVESSSKTKSESVHVVRAKLRDSLTAYLSLVSPTSGMLYSEGESPQLKPEKLMAHGSQASGSHAIDLPCGDLLSVGSSDVVASTSKSSNGDDISLCNDVGSNIDPLGTLKQNSIDGKWDASFSPESNIVGDDHFIIKDDLLQGNGLTWAFDTDGNMEAVGEARDSIKGEPANGSKKLAYEIEVELFNLYGGVTKKYKEKGRSLLFNLKDPSNPDLREKVVFGEISPKRLCSMTAEELASKELSQWRIAKAEELAQMVVLPEVDMDVRRMVKKTHKGEVQVEMEDDGVSVEVSLGGGPQAPRKYGDTTLESGGDSKAIKYYIGDPVNIHNEISEAYILPDYNAVESDLMLESMADECKDKEPLPSISCIDNFVDFTDFDHPFCDLPVDGTTDFVVSNKEQKATDDYTQDGSFSLTPGSFSNLRKSSCKVIWEGSIQLTVSVMSEFAAVFRRGEKTSGEEWGSPVEVKGRVRMEAFKKFVGELPKSRTRAVMVADFVLKDNSVEGLVSEVVESYACDERVGLAEPAPGVEIYLFPPREDIVSQHHILLHVQEKEEQMPILPFPPSMIGLVVWRRNLGPLPPLDGATTPNSKRHHHHHHKILRNSGGGSSSSRRQPTPPLSLSPLLLPKLELGRCGDEDGDCEDIPPGFGPHDEDLPEFNFAPSDSSNAPTLLDPGGSPFLPSKPIHHMRELVHKFGVSAGVPGRKPQLRHADDDDDDIPEWKPDVQKPLPPNLLWPQTQPPNHH